MKEETKPNIAITIIIAILLEWTIGTYLSDYIFSSPEQEITITISPKSDYVDYNPMDNPSDSLAMVLQELKCDKLN